VTNDPSNQLDPATVLPRRAFLESAGAFWTAIIVGAALRIYCIAFTNGTGDMDDWEDHATQVRDRGLIGYYHANTFANHPPFMSEASASLLRLSTATHIPFRILFRTPFAILDGANAFLLFLLLPQNRWRFVATACYWLSPAAIIISSYHGNTDTAVPFFILLSIWLATKQRTILSGAGFGAGFWVKLPGILGLPALLLLFQNWRARIVFLLAGFITASITYLPALIQDYRIVWTNVFGYRGLILQTAGGMPLWGPSVLLFSTFVPMQAWSEKYLNVVLFLLERSPLIAIAAVLILTWFRKDRHLPQQVCATIGMSYAILFGFSDYWAFQYFAWSLPFWFFLRWWFSVPAAALTGAYLYSLHWLFCGNPWLLGGWNFAGQPTLPVFPMILRDLAVAFFFVSAWAFLFLAWRRRKVVPA
jgi:hypothetical protein